MTRGHHPQSHINRRSSCQIRSRDKIKILLQETLATKFDMLLAFDSLIRGNQPQSRMIKWSFVTNSHEIKGDIPPHQ